MLQVEQLQSFYGESHILHGVSLHIGERELVTLLGRNGVGKTTSLKSIMGMVKVRSGSIAFNGESILGKRPDEIFHRGLGYVPQGRRIFASLTVEENLNLARVGRDTRRLEGLLNLFAPLRERLQNRGNQLSGGEQQMLAIARVLVSGPKLVLLDEPSEGLAPLLVKAILDTLQELKQTGLTVLLVESNLEMALKLGDRHYIMDQGLVVCEPSAQQLKEDEELIRRYFRI